MHSTVVPAGQLIDGGMISSTVKTCEQLLTFPQLSAMEYVRVTVFGHTPVEVWLTNVKLATFIPQLSDAVPPAAINCARVV